jgi:hypothetical protein
LARSASPLIEARLKAAAAGSRDAMRQAMKMGRRGFLEETSAAATLAGLVVLPADMRDRE